MIQLKTLFLVGSILCFSVYSFTYQKSSRLLNLRKTYGTQRLYSDKNDKSVVGDKLAYDEKTNRFFESSTVSSGNTVLGEEEFCLKDAETGQIILLTKEEKERIFLDSIQSYYFSGKNKLSDKEFDRLREDLSWEGSALVTLNRNETKFINAVQAYAKGTPILSDKEFDELKRSLKESGSKIAVSSEPKCYVDTGVCKVTWQVDVIRTTSLYFPAALVSSILLLGVLYEIPFLRWINPLIFLLLGAYPIYSFSKQATENVLFKEPLVAAGPCPCCAVENKVFFGDVFGVKGDDDESSIKCTNCKANLTIKRATLRVSTLLPSRSKDPTANREKAASLTVE